MKRIHAIVVFCLAVYGCGVIPGGGRFVSDYQKASHYALHGASKTRVKLDWGAPDEVQPIEEGEVWIYRDREEGKTFIFTFDERGRLKTIRLE